MADPIISVIIPTYNRKTFLLKLLDSLSQQDISANHWEVIVVDDGSSDGTHEIRGDFYPFQFKLLSQPNSGCSTARNLGAKESRGSVLIFIDDDIRPQSGSIMALYNLCKHAEPVIAVGNTILPEAFRQHNTYAEIVKFEPLPPSTDEEIQFTRCNTQLMAIKSKDFFDLEMFHEPAGKSPNWEDIDFGFRAHQKGLRVIYCHRAVAEHWDYARIDLSSACNLYQSRSKSVVRLFHVHLKLKYHLSFFYYFFPINWQHDSLLNIGRKIARRIVSAPLMLRLVERITHSVETCCPSKILLRRLYRWITWGYVYRGFKQGMNEYGRIDYYDQ